MRLGGFILLLVSVSYVTSFRQVCYYTNWSASRPDQGHFTPADIDPNLCTHIIFAYARVVGERIVPTGLNDENSASFVGFYERVTSLKLINPELKVLLGVNGWNTRFHPDYSLGVVASTNFVQDTIDFLRQRDFDGIDLDWEYSSRRRGLPTSRDGFTELLRELRNGFDAEAIQTGKPRLLLSAAVTARRGDINIRYDVPNMARYVDIINVMSYDFHGPWKATIGHSSPLHRSDDQLGESVYLNTEEAMKYWISLGVDRQKLTVGIPFYGRTYTVMKTNMTEIGDQDVGIGPAGPFTLENGFMAYYEICELLRSGASRVWHVQHKAPYLISGSTWISYDDPESVREKAKWIKAQGLGGAMVWSLDLDDFSGRFCNSGRYPLLNEINSEFKGIQAFKTDTAEPAMGLIHGSWKSLAENTGANQKSISAIEMNNRRGFMKVTEADSGISSVGSASHTGTGGGLIQSGFSSAGTIGRSASKDGTGVEAISAATRMKTVEGKLQAGFSSLSGGAGSAGVNIERHISDLEEGTKGAIRESGQTKITGSTLRKDFQVGTLGSEGDAKAVGGNVWMEGERGMQTDVVHEIPVGSTGGMFFSGHDMQVTDKSNIQPRTDAGLVGITKEDIAFQSEMGLGVQKQFDSSSQLAELTQASTSQGQMMGGASLHTKPQPFINTQPSKDNKPRAALEANLIEQIQGEIMSTGKQGNLVKKDMQASKAGSKVNRQGEKGLDENFVTSNLVGASVRQNEMSAFQAHGKPDLSKTGVKTGVMEKVDIKLGVDGSQRTFQLGKGSSQGDLQIGPGIKTTLRSDTQKDGVRSKESVPSKSTSVLEQSQADSDAYIAWQEAAGRLFEANEGWRTGRGVSNIAVASTVKDAHQSTTSIIQGDAKGDDSSATKSGLKASFGEISGEMEKQPLISDSKTVLRGTAAHSTDIGTPASKMANVQQTEKGREYIATISGTTDSKPGKELVGTGEFQTILDLGSKLPADTTRREQQVQIGTTEEKAGKRLSVVKGVGMFQSDAGDVAMTKGIDTQGSTNQAITSRRDAMQTKIQLDQRVAGVETASDIIVQGRQSVEGVYSTKPEQGQHINLIKSRPKVTEGGIGVQTLTSSPNLKADGNVNVVLRENTKEVTNFMSKPDSKSFQNLGSSQRVSDFSGGLVKERGVHLTGGMQLEFQGGQSLSNTKFQDGEPTALYEPGLIPEVRSQDSGVLKSPEKVGADIIMSNSGIITRERTQSALSNQGALKPEQQVNIVGDRIEADAGRQITYNGVNAFSDAQLSDRSFNLVRKSGSATRNAGIFNLETDFGSTIKQANVRSNLGSRSSDIASNVAGLQASDSLVLGATDMRPNTIESVQSGEILGASGGFPVQKSEGVIDSTGPEFNTGSAGTTYEADGSRAKFGEARRIQIPVKNGRVSFNQGITVTRTDTQKMRKLSGKQLVDQDTKLQVSKVPNIIKDTITGSDTKIDLNIVRPDISSNIQTHLRQDNQAIMSDKTYPHTSLASNTPGIGIKKNNLRESSFTSVARPIVHKSSQLIDRSQFSSELQKDQTSDGTIYKQGKNIIESGKLSLRMPHDSFASSIFSWSGTAPDLVPEDFAQGNIISSLSGQQFTQHKASPVVKSKSAFREVSINTREFGSPLDDSLNNAPNMISYNKPKASEPDYALRDSVNAGGKFISRRFQTRSENIQPHKIGSVLTGVEGDILNFGPGNTAPHISIDSAIGSIQSNEQTAKTRVISDGEFIDGSSLTNAQDGSISSSYPVFVTKSIHMDTSQVNQNQSAFNGNVIMNQPAVIKSKTERMLHVKPGKQTNQGTIQNAVFSWSGKSPSPTIFVDDIGTDQITLGNAEDTMKLSKPSSRDRHFEAAAETQELVGNLDGKTRVIGGMQSLLRKSGIAERQVFDMSNMSQEGLSGLLTARKTSTTDKQFQSIQSNVNAIGNQGFQTDPKLPKSTGYIRNNMSGMTQINDNQFQHGDGSVSLMKSGLERNKSERGMRFLDGMLPKEGEIKIVRSGIKVIDGIEGMIPIKHAQVSSRHIQLGEAGAMSEGQERLDGSIMTSVKPDVTGMSSNIAQSSNMQFKTGEVTTKTKENLIPLDNLQVDSIILRGEKSTYMTTDLGSGTRISLPEGSQINQGSFLALDQGGIQTDEGTYPTDGLQPQGGKMNSVRSDFKVVKGGMSETDKSPISNMQLQGIQTGITGTAQEKIKMNSNMIPSIQPLVSGSQTNTAQISNTQYETGELKTVHGGNVIPSDNLQARHMQLQSGETIYVTTDVGNAGQTVQSGKQHINQGSFIISGQGKIPAEGEILKTGGMQPQDGKIKGSSSSFKIVNIKGGISPTSEAEGKGIRPHVGEASFIASRKDEADGIGSMSVLPNQYVGEIPPKKEQTSTTQFRVGEIKPLTEGSMLQSKDLNIRSMQLEGGKTNFITSDTGTRGHLLSSRYPDINQGIFTSSREHIQGEEKNLQKDSTRSRLGKIEVVHSDSKIINAVGGTPLVGSTQRNDMQLQGGMTSFMATGQKKTDGNMATVDKSQVSETLSDKEQIGNTQFKVGSTKYFPEGSLSTSHNLQVKSKQLQGGESKFMTRDTAPAETVLLSGNPQTNEIRFQGGDSSFLKSQQGSYQAGGANWHANSKQSIDGKIKVIRSGITSANSGKGHLPTDGTQMDGMQFQDGEANFMATGKDSLTSSSKPQVTAMQLQGGQATATDRGDFSIESYTASDIDVVKLNGKGTRIHETLNSGGSMMPSDNMQTRDMQFQVGNSKMFITPGTNTGVDILPLYKQQEISSDTQSGFIRRDQGNTIQFQDADAKFKESKQSVDVLLDKNQQASNLRMQSGETNFIASGQGSMNMQLQGRQLQTPESGTVKDNFFLGKDLQIGDMEKGTGDISSAATGSAKNIPLEGIQLQGRELRFDTFPTGTEGKMMSLGNRQINNMQLRSGEATVKITSSDGSQAQDSVKPSSSWHLGGLQFREVETGLGKDSLTDTLALSGGQTDFQSTNQISGQTKLNKGNSGQTVGNVKMTTVDNTGVAAGQAMGGQQSDGIFVRRSFGRYIVSPDSQTISKSYILPTDKIGTEESWTTSQQHIDGTLIRQPSSGRFMISTSSSDSGGNYALDPIVNLESFLRSKGMDPRLVGISDGRITNPQHFISMGSREFVTNSNRINADQGIKSREKALNVNGLSNTQMVASGLDSNLLQGKTINSGKTEIQSQISSKSVPKRIDCEPGSLICLNHINQVVIRGNNGKDKVGVWEKTVPSENVLHPKV